MNNKKKITVSALLAAALLLTGCNNVYNQYPITSYTQTTTSTISETPIVTTPAITTPAVTTPAVTTSKPVETSAVTTPAITTSESVEASTSTTYDWYEEALKNVVITREDLKSSKTSIKKVCGIKSKVETDYEACLVLTEKDHNPYDVVYDYGRAYDGYVDSCDWDLVFDADFYMKKFPLLAMQYHNDKKLLLEHFQTIGIHEGRQGNASFNVGTYKNNCDADIRNAFGDNYEGYYFYYMLNQYSEKSVTTTSSNDKIQQKAIMTAFQAEELKGVNEYRREVGVAEIAFDSELSAFANLRSYHNAHDGYRHHDWAKQNGDCIDMVMDLYGNIYKSCHSTGENTVTITTSRPHVELCYSLYYTSKEHYEAMVDAENDFIGISNCSYGTGIVSQFDCFIDI